MNGRELLMALVAGLVLWLIAPAGVSPVAQGHSGQSQIMDSPTWTWNTFLGGANWDDGYAIAVDRYGNVYVAGTSKGSWGSPVRSFRGSFENAFVAKLNSSGALVWNTFLGSATGMDEAYAIAVDGNGVVTVAGASTDSWGSPAKSHSEEYFDAFVARLNANGSLRWNTFMGGASNDNAYGVAIDTSGNVYVAGESHGAWGQPVNPPSSSLTNQEVFVAKLNANGARLWNTFMGNRNGADYARAIAFAGSVYVAGYSMNGWGSPVRAHSGDWYGDGFAAKLNPDNGARNWNTFLGGAGTDECRGIASAAGKVYVTGYSYVGWGTPVSPWPGNSDNIFVSRLTTNGGLVWNTFLGGGNWEDDKGHAIAATDDGKIFVAGESRYSWGTPAHPHENGYDGFAAELNSNGAVVWNTFLGDDDTDYAFGIAARGNTVYVVGESHVTYYDWGTPIRPGSSSYDAWVVTLYAGPALNNKAYMPLIMRKN